MHVYDRLIHIDLNGTLVPQNTAEVKQVVDGFISIICKSEARQSTEVLVESKGNLYSRLRYDKTGQAKMVSQITVESMREQLISQLKQDKDFAEDQLKNTSRGFITRKGEALFVWTRKFKSTEAYQVLKLDNDMKVIVFNDDVDTRCTYELVNDFLVRRKEEAIHLEVF